MALADFQTLVESMVPKADSGYGDPDRDSALQLAVAQYGQDVPRELVNDVTWIEAGYFGPLPADWSEGAALIQAEHPIGNVPASEIDVSIYVKPGLVQTLVTPDALDVDAVVRVTFAAPHVLVDGAEPLDTIPLKHREAVASYAASVLCRQLATKFSSERETAISADGSNTESRSRNFAFRAKDYRAAYYTGIGKADPMSAGGSASGSDAAGAVTSWPSRSKGSLTRMNW